ncbi:MAG: hypothetical protein JEZ07_18355 [Phycisphaerae bacterium]|nr:hypothetical protein [Phycisphaerae bacterium]
MRKKNIIFYVMLFLLSLALIVYAISEEKSSGQNIYDSLESKSSDFLKIKSVQVSELDIGKSDCFTNTYPIYLANSDDYKIMNLPLGDLSVEYGVLSGSTLRVKFEALSMYIHPIDSFALRDLLWPGDYAIKKYNKILNKGHYSTIKDSVEAIGSSIDEKYFKKMLDYDVVNLNDAHLTYEDLVDNIILMNMRTRCFYSDNYYYSRPNDNLYLLQIKGSYDHLYRVYSFDKKGTPLWYASCNIEKNKTDVEALQIIKKLLK